MPMGVKKTSGGRKRNQPSKETNEQKECSPLQVLYNTCKEVFENCGPGIIPSPENIQRLKDIMDGMTEADVGLRPGMKIFRSQWKQKFPSISYFPIYECHNFSIGLFCLPRSAVIPLHNHPEMTVFCKPLFGTMYVNSFDWANAANPPNEDGVFSAGPLRTANSAELGSDFEAHSANGITAGALRLANIKADHEISAPCNTTALYPTDGGNLHTFTALTPCAFLDVLGPPYSDPEGRHCTYFRKYPFSSLPAVGKLTLEPEEQKQGYAWLEEIEKGEGSLVYTKMYTGPEIVTE